MSEAPEFPQLLEAFRNGQEGALESILPLIYGDLRQIAQRSLRQWNSMTLDTTGLVHETYLKLRSQQVLRAEDRGHFLSICARAMRQLVVDHVREKMALKRGAGALVVGLDSLSIGHEDHADQLVFLDQALVQLADIDEGLVRVFECRYFAGMTDDETAGALDRPLRSIQLDWMRARARIRELCEAG